MLFIIIFARIIKIATVAMTLWFYLKVKVGKFLANAVSGLIWDRKRRRQLRSRLDPLNPERCVAYLEKHYADKVRGARCEVRDAGNEEDFIWVCWLQGLDEAPQLVRNCIHSIAQHKRSQQRLVLLTADNYNSYVTLPTAIIEKWHQGKISNTHFSDLLRIHALSQYGGLWVDATCYQTGPVPASILESPLFLFHSHGEFSYTLIQSCFIYAKRGHYVLRQWCAAMDDYWEHENRLINYFTLHLMFIALTRRDERFAQAFSQIPVMSDEPMHVLLRAMLSGANYSDALMAEAGSALFIQKLTYKFSASLLDNPLSVAAYFSQEIGSE